MLNSKCIIDLPFWSIRGISVLCFHVVWNLFGNGVIESSHLLLHFDKGWPFLMPEENESQMSIRGSLYSPWNSPQPHTSKQTSKFIMSVHNRLYLLVCPALFHQFIHGLRTSSRAIQTITTINKTHDLWAFHFLHEEKEMNEKSHVQLIEVGFNYRDSVNIYLIRLSSIGEGLPHRNAKAPNVTFAGELMKLNALWCVPLQRPFTTCTGLHTKPHSEQIFTFYLFIAPSISSIWLFSYIAVLGHWWSCD